MIFTETMRERKQRMQEESDACIVLPGGIGTLEEFFEILTLKQLGRDDRAIVLLNTLGAFDAMLRMLEELAERRFMSKTAWSCISWPTRPSRRWNIWPAMFRRRAASAGSRIIISKF